MCDVTLSNSSYDDEYEQGQNGAYYSERAYTRVTVRRTYDSDKPTANELGMYSKYSAGVGYFDTQPLFIATVGIPLGILFLLLIVGTVVLTVFAKSTGRWCFADDDYQYRDPQSNKRPPTHAQVYRFTLNSYSFLQLLFVCPLVDDNFLNIFPVSAMMVQTKGSPKPTQVTLLQTVLKNHQGPALENK